MAIPESHLISKFFVFFFLVRDFQKTLLGKRNNINDLKMIFDISQLRCSYKSLTPSTVSE